MNHKNNTLKQIYDEVSKGKLRISEFNQIKQKLDVQIQEHLQKLDNGNRTELYVSSPSRKIVETEYDSVQNQTQIYNKLYDHDLIRCQGDFQKALDIKFFKEELSLIKLSIVKKLSLQIQLNENEKKFTSQWVELIKKDQDFQVCSATNLTYGDLSYNDKKILSEFQYSNLNQFEKFGLKDFILELGLFYNFKLVQDIERNLKSQYLREQWGITLNNESSQNYVNEYILNQIENTIWRQEKRFSQNQLDNILNFLKISRQNTPQQRQEFLEYEAKFNQLSELIPEMNNVQDVFLKWIIQKDKELQQANDLTVDELWKETFGSEYQKTTTQELHSFVEQFSVRIHLLRKSQPKTFSKFMKNLLIHRSLSYLDKNLLLGVMENYTLELNLDSDDIIQALQTQKNNNQKKSLEDLKKILQQPDTTVSTISNLLLQNYP